jgi:hypothetical protein
MAAKRERVRGQGYAKHRRNLDGGSRLVQKKLHTRKGKTMTHEQHLAWAKEYARAHGIDGAIICGSIDGERVYFNDMVWDDRWDRAPRQVKVFASTNSGRHVFNQFKDTYGECFGCVTGTESKVINPYIVDVQTGVESPL